MSSINYSITGDKAQHLNTMQKLGLVLATMAFFIVVMYISTSKILIEPTWLFFPLMLFGFAAGTAFYTWGTYKGLPAGIKNNGVYFNALTNRGSLAWVLGVFLTLFYVFLYWYPEYLGLGVGENGTNRGLVALFDGMSHVFRNKDADQWFVYGSFYTMAILFLGIKFIVKYRHNRYHLIRTIVVIFSQLVFAYFLPFILEALNANSAGYYSLNPVNFYPLNYSFFTADQVNAMAGDGNQPFGLAYLVWGIIGFLVLTPIITYYVGKRWYCSWFCGCGGLAETAGDSFRHLSNKSVKAWKIERWLIHSVMVFVFIMTLAVMYTYFLDAEFALQFAVPNRGAGMVILFSWIGLGLIALLFLRWKAKGNSRKYLLVGAALFTLIGIVMLINYSIGNHNAFGISSYKLKEWYGFYIGAIFSGIIGVGFYPILGNRVWCRFGCPMAGYMGIVQRFKSRFRITTNGGQCISCGNCSTYCEQGIDVRWYAQRGQNIVRASCVGCGVCSSVCPRGVLKLENGPEDGRINDNPIILGNDMPRMNPNVK